MMCGRFFGIFVCIPKVDHTLIFCTKNERSRYDWLCFLLCNSCSPLELESNFQWRYADAFHYRKWYNPGGRQSNRSYLHNGSGDFPPPSNWQRKIPLERYHRERQEQKKIALLRNLEADFWIRELYIENLCRYEKADWEDAFSPQTCLGMLKVPAMYPYGVIVLLL